MNEEQTEQIEDVEAESIEQVEGTSETLSTIETPLGDATRTVEVDPTTGEAIERITKADLDALTEHMAKLVEINQKIDEKTITTTADGSPLSLTYEQGEIIIEKLALLETAGLTVILVCAVVFVFRWVYKFFAGTLFGGL